MITQEKAKEIISDLLAGEVSAEDADKLEEYAKSDPEISEYRKTLETVWGFSREDLYPDESLPMSPELEERVVAEADEEARNSGKVIKLDFDVLDNLAAAGQNGIPPENDDEGRHD